MLAGADTLLGPEMRSTGEVMGIDVHYPQAYAKAALAAGQKLPTGGKVFLTVMDKHKDSIVPIAQQLQVRSWPCLACLMPCQMYYYAMQQIRQEIIIANSFIKKQYLGSRNVQAHGMIMQSAAITVI